MNAHTPEPWLRTESGTVYALDETASCNRFSARVEGGWKWRSSGSIGASGDRTPVAELEANSRLIWSAPQLLKALNGLCDAIDDLIANSHGVTGLHLNGDVAPWESLIEGGQFEPWLLALSDARATISSATGES